MNTPSCIKRALASILTIAIPAILIAASPGDTRNGASSITPSANSARQITVSEGINQKTPVSLMSVSCSKECKGDSSIIIGKIWSKLNAGNVFQAVNRDGAPQQADLLKSRSLVSVNIWKTADQYVLALRRMNLSTMRTEYALYRSDTHANIDQLIAGMAGELEDNDRLTRKGPEESLASAR